YVHVVPMPAQQRARFRTRTGPPLALEVTHHVVAAGTGEDLGDEAGAGLEVRQLEEERRVAVDLDAARGDPSHEQHVIRTVQGDALRVVRRIERIEEADRFLLEPGGHLEPGALGRMEASPEAVARAF